MIEVQQTGIEGVVVVRPYVSRDGRGYFTESFSLREFREKVRSVDFVQDNQSLSRRGVLRGLHYQLAPMAQSKLVRAVRGRILDVAVDVRRGSPTFGRHVAVELSEENMCQLFVPHGFAHGFVTLSDEAMVLYKCDNYYSPEHEASLAFDDPELGIDWLLTPDELVLSDRDRRHPPLAEARLFDCTSNLYE